MSNQLKSPEEFFGFRLGSDRKIARWDRIVEFFHHLGESSDKIRVTDMGSIMVLSVSMNRKSRPGYLNLANE